jgi:hypothetical protein
VRTKVGRERRHQLRQTQALVTDRPDGSVRVIRLVPGFPRIESRGEMVSFARVTRRHVRSPRFVIVRFGTSPPAIPSTRSDSRNEAGAQMGTDMGAAAAGAIAAIPSTTPKSAARIEFCSGSDAAGSDKSGVRHGHRLGKERLAGLGIAADLALGRFRRAQ